MGGGTGTGSFSHPAVHGGRPRQCFEGSAAYGQGEQVVILRGSRPAVTFLKVTESDLGLHPEISSGALSDFQAEIERERAGSQIRVGPERK